MNVKINDIVKVWPKISRYVSVPHTKEQYENAINMLDQLIEKIGEDESHPLASLMETLGTLIENYESQHLPFPETAAGPVGVLKYLMNEHGLKQGDLSEIGSQGVVSEVLKEKRELNVRQIRALSRRFNVSPAVFL
ncbi:MAG: transcriptional regulator [bacterium]|nr:transcriptional regulator [bacterium]